MSQSLVPFKQEALANAWNKMNTAQRVGLGTLVIAALTAIIFFVAWAQTPEYVAAFTDVDTKDGASIVAYLKEQSIPYQVTENAGGVTIRVPASQVHEVRLSLAAQGLPGKGTVGFELFDTTNLGLTDFTQQVNYQRALEGELARTISSLTVVRAARVHIVIPKPTLFSQDEKPTTASIMVDVETGQQLSKEQVKAISHLVSSAVEGLTPDNLTIVDMNGNVLSDGSGNSGLADAVALSSSQIDTQRQVEKTLEYRIKSMLENVLGPDQAVVRVAAEMNWDQVHTESENYVPADQGSVVRSSRQITESAAGTDGSTGGIPGASSNIPGAAPSYQTTVTDTNGSSYQRTDVTTNFEVSRSTSVVESATGQIKRLSVSVLVNNITDTTVISAIQSATIAAAGIDTARGDELTVNSIPFDRSYFVEQEAAMKAVQQREFYLLLARWGIVVVALGAVFFVVRGMQRSLSLQRMEVLPDGTVAAKGALSDDPRTTLLDSIDVATALDGYEGLGQIGPPKFGESEKEAAAKMQMLRQLQLVAKNRPETLAQVIQFWLTEE